MKQNHFVGDEYSPSDDYVNLISNLLTEYYGKGDRNWNRIMIISTILCRRYPKLAPKLAHDLCANI